MLGSPVFNVALGLMFVFLLYSLMATTVMELLASFFGLRARLLRTTIYRMLNDDKAEKALTIKRVKQGVISFICFFLPPRWKWFRPEQSFAWAFYNMPGIKYLGLSNWFKRPSYINPDRFAKTLCDLLKESVSDNSLSEDGKIESALTSGTIRCDGSFCNIDPETHRFLKSLWAETPAEGQTHEEKFRILLVEWYNETMELLTGRYKRRMQLNLFFLGFFVAMIFNVNTIEISARLSKNDKAREAMVQLAGAWIENNGTDSVPSGAGADTVTHINQMVQRTVKMLEDDINEPNNLLALGYQIPDNFSALGSSMVKKITPRSDSTADSVVTPIATSRRDSAEWLVALKKVYDRRCRQVAEREVQKKPLSVNMASAGPCSSLPYDTELTSTDRLRFVIYRILTNYSLIGFLITAIAISLGAPFWFDLLNKVVKIKNEGKKPQ